MLRGVVGQIFISSRQNWEAFLARTPVERLIASKLTIPAVIFVGFLFLSLGTSGPAYLSDEVGYLSKAATIAGSPVQLTTSWFAGYSFLISPAFFISSDPFVNWKIILVLNAAMWAGTAALLQYLLRFAYPKISNRAVFFATLGAMLYPSWLSMSGYAFATTGFVLVFMAALAAIAKSRLTHIGWLGLATAFAGYLAWIHPLGFMFLALWVALLALWAVLSKRWILLAIAGVGLNMGLLYIGVIHPWLNQAMSGSIVNDSHYTKGVIANLLNALPTWRYWLQAGLLLAGFLFFTLIATFGLAAYGFLDVLRQFVRSGDSWKVKLQDARTVIRCIPFVLVAGVIVFTALSWAVTGQLRIDQWVYGRYTDMYLLPVIASGLLAVWGRKQAVVTGLIVVASGVLLSVMTNPQNTSFAFNNKVNIQSLWPMHVASIAHLNHYWLWGLLGAAGIILCGMMGRRYKLYLPILIVPIALAGAGNYIYNSRVTSQHSSVSTLYDYVKGNYSRTDCIGFTPETDSHERFNLYSYYLHGYDIKKMTMDQWQDQHCAGPYLTYDSQVAAVPSLQVAGIEQRTGLYMVTRTDQPVAGQRQRPVIPVTYTNTTHADLVRYALIFK